MTDQSSTDGTPQPYRNPGAPKVIQSDVDLYDALSHHLQNAMTIAHMGTGNPDLGEEELRHFENSMQHAMYMIMNELFDAKAALEQWNQLPVERSKPSAPLT